MKKPLNYEDFLEALELGFEGILNFMLAEVDDDLDKREGSVIYTAVAPVALLTERVFYEMETLLRRTFADTARDEDLDRRLAEHGFPRLPATRAVRALRITASPTANVPLGSKFALNELLYTYQGVGNDNVLQIVCDTAGSVGNRDFGEVTPTVNIQGLDNAVLADVLIPGEDEETDEAYYARFQEFIKEKDFAGNRASYKRVLRGIAGVGTFRLFRAPEGGGTVGVELLDSEYNVPSPELVASVQEVLDPVEAHKEGTGTAAIGQKVTVSPAQAQEVAVETTLELSPNVDIQTVKNALEVSLKEYFKTLRISWGEEDSTGYNYLSSTVRLSRIESLALDIEGVVDVTSTKLNGTDGNIILADAVPELSGVVVNGE